MKAVLMSIRPEHNKNIECGSKKSELRTLPPKLTPPFKVYTYESGILGRHKVVNEWVCRSMTEWLMYMGVPAHLQKTACLSLDEIKRYCNNGEKNITEMAISDLVVYDTPKSLGEFCKPCDRDPQCDCQYCMAHGRSPSKQIPRAPQNWCYVEELQER